MRHYAHYPMLTCGANVSYQARCGPVNGFMVWSYDPIHLIPKWPPLCCSVVFFKIPLVASFLNLKLKRIFSLERGNKG